jgi:hypothetical protein
MQRIPEFVSYKENTPSFEDVVYKKSFGDKKISDPFTFHSSLFKLHFISEKNILFRKKYILIFQLLMAEYPDILVKSSVFIFFMMTVYPGSASPNLMAMNWTLMLSRVLVTNNVGSGLDELL